MYNKNLVFSSACLGMLIFGVVLTTLGAISPDLAVKFKLNDISMGGLFAVLPFGVLGGSVLFGPIVDKYGYKNLLIICSLIVLVGFEALAFSPSYEFLLPAIILVGFGGGILNGATNSLAADINTESKGANLSLLGVFFGIGALGMPAVISVLRGTFKYEAIIAIIGMFILIPVIFFSVLNFPQSKKPHGSAKNDFAFLVKQPLLILLSFILFFESGIEGLLNNWVPKYMMLMHNVDQKDAIFAMTYNVAGLTVMRLLLGYLLRKTRPYLTVCFSIFMILLGSIILYYAATFNFAVAGLVIVGMGTAAVFPVILGYVGSIYPNLSGTAFSVALVIALTGNMLLNYTLGVLSDSMSLRILPLYLIICLILMMFIFIAAAKKASSKIKI